MEKYRNLSPDLFMAEIALTADAVVIDVRTRGEAAGDPMLEGALHLDVLDSSFEERLDELDQLLPYFVYCQTGKRGRVACRLMAERGFLLTSFLEGGKDAWDKVFK